MRHAETLLPHFQGERPAHRAPTHRLSPLHSSGMLAGTLPSNQNASALLSFSLL